MKSAGIAMLLGLSSIASVDGAAIGIDFGDEFAKLTIARPGSGFQIVENLQSGRKTSNMVSFFEKTRIFGDDAQAHTSRNPKKVFTFPKAYLAAPTDKAPSVGFEGFDHYFPIDHTADEGRGVWNYKMDNGDAYSGEELVGQLLRFYKSLAEQTNKGNAVRDAVITVPADFTQRQRQALADAANLAGLEVLSLVTETTAAAVHRALDFKATDPRDVTLFINVGSRFAEACVVQTENLVDVPRKGTNTTEVRNLGCHAEAGVGGYIGDLLVADAMAKRYEQQYKRKVADEAQDGTRVLKKLLRESKKTKHVLSTNKSSGFFVEGLTSDVDFRSEISRDEFEAMIETPLTSQILKPVQEALRKAKVEFKDVTTVEVIGGGWRSPAVVTTLTNYLKEQSALLEKPTLELGQHLNGEEAMAFGASFVAANYSSLFRVKPVRLVDTLGHGVSATFLDASDAEVEAVEIIPENGALVKGHKVLPLSAKALRALLPSLERNEVPSAVNTAALKVRLSESNQALETVRFLAPQDEKPLLDALKAAETAIAALETPEERTAVLESKFGLKLKAQIDQLGLVNVTAALLAVPVPPVPVVDAATNATTTPEWTSKTFALRAERETYLAPLPMTAEAQKTASVRLASLEAFDRLQQQASEGRNSLEAFVYDVRNKLEEWDALKSVTNDEQRETLSAELQKAEDWLWDEAMGMTAEELLPALKAFRAPLDTLANAALDRAKEFENRPKAAELVAKLSKKVLKQLSPSADDTKAFLPAWVSETQRESVRTLIVELETWFANQTALHVSHPLTEAPLFTYKDVALKAQRIVKRVDQLKSTPKPKPTTTTTKAAASENQEKTPAEEQEKTEQETQQQETADEAQPETEAAEQEEQQEEIKGEGSQTEEQEEANRDEL